MIDEDVLSDLVAEAAQRIPAPGRAPDALLEAIAASEEVSARRRPRGRLVLGAAAAVVLVVLAGAVLRGRDDTSKQVSFGESTLTEDVDESASATTTTMVPTEAPAGATGASTSAGMPSSAGTGSSAGSAGGAGGGTTPPAPPTAQAPSVADSARVIKTGSIDLEVPARGFEPTMERITSMAIGLGGYVAESSTSESGDVPRGSITLRIPADSFDGLLTDLRALGEVQSVGSKGTDVTAQFTDLAARLSALTATRDRLYEVLRGARNIGDIIAVQDRITGVQTEIEQIQGQQHLLEDQTTFGTLSITLAEPGAERIEIAADQDDGLGAAWDDAKDRFGDSVEALVAWSGSAAVVAIIGLLVLGLARLAWPRIKRRLV